jgi:hypothetical protein
VVEAVIFPLDYKCNPHGFVEGTIVNFLTAMQRVNLFISYSKVRLESTRFEMHSGVYKVRVVSIQDAKKQHPPRPAYLLVEAGKGCP